MHLDVTYEKRGGKCQTNIPLVLTGSYADAAFAFFPRSFFSCAGLGSARAAWRAETRAKAAYTATVSKAGILIFV